MQGVGISSLERPYKLAILASHPVQYFAPLFKHISSNPSIDLTVYYISDLSVREFYDPGFATNLKWDVPLLDGYRYVFLPRAGAGNQLSFWSPWCRGLLRNLRAGRFEALWLMGWGYLTYLRALAIARILGIKVLMWSDSHAGGPGTYSARNLRAKRFIFPLLFSCVDGFLAGCAANREWYRSYGVPSERIFFTPYTVDNEFFQKGVQEARCRREQFRRELKLEAGRPVILYASKFLVRKRADDLIEAYARLSPDGEREPRSYLLLVGDGEQRPLLEARARELGWPSIKFLGFKNQSELPALFDLCDVFVLVPEREGLATVIAEVMNAGKPVIISDTVGLAGDLVGEGENGFIVPPRSPALLADRLKMVLDNPGLAATMGEKSLQRITGWNFEASQRGILRALEHCTRRQLSTSRVDSQPGTAGGNDGAAR